MFFCSRQMLNAMVAAAPNAAAGATAAAKAAGGVGAAPAHLSGVLEHVVSGVPSRKMKLHVASGAASLGGQRPANTSGGLVSKGHPLGASGVAMIHELVTQLRGEAGDRQVTNAQVGVQQNGGGMIGFDEAATSVMVLKRP